MSKIKYEDVKQSIEEAGWTLVSKEYVNLKTDLIALCPLGHEVHFPFDQWRHGKTTCDICSRQPFKKINELPKKKEGYRVLGFDQASITSGWAIFDDQKLVNYGSWSSHGAKSTERIAQTKAWVASMIEKHQPSIVYLEDIQLQKFEDGEAAVLTYKKLAHLQGVLKNYCFENGIPYDIVPPNTWKSYNNIKGKTRSDQKKSAQLRVKALYDIDVTQDEADAILLTRYAAAQHNSMKIIEF